MPSHLRAYRPGGTYFFTVNLDRRDDNDLLTRHIDRLGDAVRGVGRRHPFAIHAWVVLPDHLHCIVELPAGDDDIPGRWRLIKAAFSRSVPAPGGCPPCRRRRRGRGIWQRRYWQHLIRNGHDYRAHLDYVHVNPVRHGLVSRVADWPYSTFHRLVVSGVYPADWAGDPFDDALEMGE